MQPDLMAIVPASLTLSPPPLPAVWIVVQRHSLILPYCNTSITKVYTSAFCYSIDINLLYGVFTAILVLLNSVFSVKNFSHALIKLTP